MSGPTVLLPSQVNTDDLIFKPNKDNKPSAIKNFLITHKESILHIQFPECEVFSLNCATNPQTGQPFNPNKLSLALSLPEERPSCKNTIEMLKKMKEKIIDIVVKNSITIFSKPRSIESVTDIFSEPLRYSKLKDENGNVIEGKINTQYPPLISFPVYKDENGELSIKAESANGKPVSLDNRDIKGSYVTVIARFNGIWSNKTAFGMTWRIVKMRIIFVARPQKKIGFINDVDRIAEDNDEEDDDVVSEYGDASVERQKIPATIPILNDSDADE
jgi:hypothetical protein